VSDAITYFRVLAEIASFRLVKKKGGFRNDRDFVIVNEPVNKLQVSEAIPSVDFED
jgi:hypothetical protein